MIYTSISFINFRNNTNYQGCNDWTIWIDSSIYKAATKMNLGNNSKWIIIEKRQVVIWCVQNTDTTDSEQKWVTYQPEDTESNRIESNRIVSYRNRFSSIIKYQSIALRIKMVSCNVEAWKPTKKSSRWPAFMQSYSYS